MIFCRFDAIDEWVASCVDHTKLREVQIHGRKSFDIASIAKIINPALNKLGTINANNKHIDTPTDKKNKKSKKEKKSKKSSVQLEAEPVPSSSFMPKSESVESIRSTSSSKTSSVISDNNNYNNNDNDNNSNSSKNSSNDNMRITSPISIMKRKWTFATTAARQYADNIPNNEGKKSNSSNNSSNDNISAHVDNIPNIEDNKNMDFSNSSNNSSNDNISAHVDNISDIEDSNMDFCSHNIINEKIIKHQEINEDNIESTSQPDPATVIDFDSTTDTDIQTDSVSYGGYSLTYPV